MTFCGETPFAPPFTNDNFSGCFVLTLHAVLPAAYITIFGLIRIIQLLWVKEKLESLPQSNRKLILTVTTTTWLEIILPLLLLTMLVKETAGSTYQILALSLTGASWLFSWIVLRVEKSIRSQYSFLVPMYWVLSLVTGALELFYHSKKLAIAQSKSNESLEDKISFSVFVVRYAFVVAINIVGVILMRSWTQGYAYKPLAGTESIQGDHSESIKDSANGKPEHPSVKAPPRASSASPWIGVLQKLAKLFPFVWPKHDRKLQFYVVLSFTLLLVQRVINVYVPIYQSIVVDALAGEPGGVPFFPWQDILLYVFLRFLQGGAGGLGLFNNWRSLLWIRVEQYTTREISVTTFAHLHQLSLRYHLQRKTGEVLRVIDRGTASITALLSAILFNILPTILDIIISVIYFSIAFDIYFGIIVFASMIGYMAVTIWITEWRTRFRREMIEADNDAKQKSVDSLLNFETVKYHSAETYEVRRFRNSILNYNEADWKSQSSLVLLNSVQNIIITAGLLAGLMLAAWQVVKGDLTVGDYTLFLSYILQLYGPLNWFGTYYRSIQQNFIDMEKMLDLLNQNVEIQDDPDAPELVVTKGELEFENVVFNYDSRITALRGISFKVPAGQTVALVGQSGSGKTTIMRLVFRFYDVTSGRILIDGQDIRRVTQHSLRRSIGVVPQDTVLFNDTIEYNIQYGDLEVEGNEELLRAAAKKAQIHEKILTFPDGYQTMVGERGLRLSGGEKQRVAIARTLLKNPKIVLLDEATSALDTETERQIQASLAEMSQNRTTLVIAHRLSTIINADMILVLREGEIVERGTHEELLQQQGEYYKLWQRQLESDHEAKTKTPDTKT